MNECVFLKTDLHHGITGPSAQQSDIFGANDAKKPFTLV